MTADRSVDRAADRAADRPMDRPVDRRVDRAWTNEAVRQVEADANRSADTHLHAYPLPAHWGIDLYLKDESVHPTGSLKHRLARSLFLYALTNGWIGPHTTIVEASSGSTAVSEAYFARLLGLPFVAVMPESTSPEKIALIELYGGRCHLLADPAIIEQESRRLAAETGGHFMDQFAYAERATDWRGNNNIAQSIYQQMSGERHPIPTWIVVGAGTGGTSATIGRYARYKQHDTRLAVVDPEGSAFYRSWCENDPDCRDIGSRIEGIGRPRVEASFLPTVVDAMMRVPDGASIAATRHLAGITGRRPGGSTGTNLWGAFTVISRLLAAGETGSVVTLICDGGDRYAHTYYNDDWVRAQGIELGQYVQALDSFLSTGELVGAELRTGPLPTAE